MVVRYMVSMLAGLGLFIVVVIVCDVWVLLSGGLVGFFCGKMYVGSMR